MSLWLKKDQLNVSTVNITCGGHVKHCHVTFVRCQRMPFDWNGPFVSVERNQSRYFVVAPVCLSLCKTLQLPDVRADSAILMNTERQTSSDCHIDNRQSECEEAGAAEPEGEPD